MYEIFDLSTLKSLKKLGEMQNKPEIIEEIRDLFQLQSEKLLTEIKSAIDSQDAQRIFVCCHKLKGSAKTIGATGFAAQCERLQIIAEQVEPNFAEVKQIHFKTLDTYSKTRLILDSQF